MKAKEQLLLAEALGAAAQQSGTLRAPAQSTELMQMLEGRKIGATPTNEAPSRLIMRAWLKGWDLAKKVTDISKH